MSHQADAVATRPEGRRFWFERDGDLPFYNGLPVALSGGQWALVIGAVALGFAALTAPIPGLQGGTKNFAPVILFVAIPLAALAIVAPRAWTHLFRPASLGDVGWMISFALLNIAVTFAIGFGVQKFLGAAPNPMFGLLAGMSNTDRLLLFGRTIPQLFGEELLTILLFLACAALLYGPIGLSRRWALAGAWLASAAVFGALHLSTYAWNIAQCLLIIGSARLVLTLPYVMTRNIWVSTGAHIANDWLLLGIGMSLAGLRA